MTTFIKDHYPGLGMTALLAAIATFLGGYFPLIGSAVFAILLGIILRNTLGVSPSWQKGIQYSGKKLLQYSIIAMGFSMSFRQVTATGIQSLSLTLITITVAFLTAWWLGKALQISPNMRTLVGFGTAICGGSAIAAAAPILEANEEEIALSISTIFLFNIVAVFLFPFLGHLMHMTDAAFGLWAGTAINDTSSVVAAGYSYSESAGDIATIVKLTRALMIVPSCLLMVAVKIRSNRHQSQKISFQKLVPWFILWFLLASLLSTLEIFPAGLIPLAKTLSKWLMAMALAGIGCQVSLQQFKKAGLKPILTGAVAWFAVAVSSLILQNLWY